MSDHSVIVFVKHDYLDNDNEHCFNKFVEVQDVGVGNNFITPAAFVKHLQDLYKKNNTKRDVFTIENVIVC